MDKNNIIDFTLDINQLENDYSNWLMLPHKYRVISNGECMKLYGCTVYDRYIRMKSYILNKKDKEEQDENNIEKIDESLSDYDNYENKDYLLSISRNIQQSPYIIIIDPVPTSISELDDKYDSFLKLNHKFKIFSNDYSIQLWGYNVDQMYKMIRSDIISREKIANDKDNITIEDSALITSIKEAVDPIKNKQISIAAQCDSLLSNANNVVKTPNDPVAKAIYMNEAVSVSLYQNIDIPAMIPYLNYEEMIKFGSNFNESDSKTYYNKVKAALESGDERAILDLGWNPSVPLNEKSVKFARERQRRWFDENFVNVYNLENYTGTDTIETDKDIVYLLYKNPIPSNNDIDRLENLSNGCNYDKIGISFNLQSLDEDNVFSIEVCNNEPATIKFENIKNFTDEFFEVVAVLIDKTSHDKLLENIRDLYISKKEVNINNIFRFIYNSSDTMDRTKEKMIYSMTLDIIRKIVSDNMEYDYSIFNFYRVFKGSIDEFDPDKIAGIVDTIFKFVDSSEKTVKENDDLLLIDIDPR